MIELYAREYVRLPTAGDLKSIEKLHSNKHGINGMFGSLDCMHVYWKNCPVAWQGQYKGKGAKPSIVLEAIADHHLWFWHSSFGYAGTLNDLNILSLSPFIESLTNGNFVRLETEAGVVPYSLDGESFGKLFVMVDGIYPNYSRFVKVNRHPIMEAEKQFTAWQEHVRKDIERAFGVLQAKFQIVAKPLHAFNLNQISDTVNCCLILHNMCVEERVMGEITRYQPDFCLDENVAPVVEYPREYEPTTASGIGICLGSDEIRDLLVKRAAWTDLRDGYEHIKLSLALTRVVGNQYRNE
jgi:Plant transposon protein